MGNGFSTKDDDTSTDNPQRKTNKNPKSPKKDLKKQKKTSNKNSSIGSILGSTTVVSKSVKGSTNKVKIMSTVMSVQSMASVLHPILNYSTDHQDVQQALELLEQYEFNVNAIWVVSRPIDRVANGKFNHWALKILADPILLTLDFFEKNGAGSFGVHAVTVGWEELEEFLYYYKKENEQWKKKKWKIESYVMPTFKQKRSKFNNMSPDNDDIYTMPEEITDCKLEMDDLNENNNNKVVLMESINCDKIVSDISNFIQQWNEKYECYNALTNNCQRFVQDLYEWLLSDKEESDDLDNLTIRSEYVEKCKSLASKLQSWNDWVVEVEKWKKYEIETNKKDPFEDEDQNQQVSTNQIKHELSKQNGTNNNKNVNTIQEEEEPEEQNGKLNNNEDTQQNGKN